METVAAWRRGQVVVDYAQRGVPLPEIAVRLGVPEAEARARLRAALVRTLEPGLYSAIVTGSNTASNLALVEVYEVSGSTPRLMRGLRLGGR